MKHLFVSYEIARQLKEKGFDEECIVSYEDYNDTGKPELYPLVTWHEVGGVNPSFVKHAICAPLYQQVIDWFREKHTIDIVYNPIVGFEVWDYSDKIKAFVQEDESTPYYEALTKAIEEAIKLI